MNVHSVKARLWGMVLVPVILSLTIGGMEIKDKKENLDTHKQVSLHVKDIKKLLGWIHAAQIERGRTAAWMTSGTDNAKKDMEEARLQTNKQMASLRQSGNNQGWLEGSFHGHHLKKIENLRASVDSNSLKSSEAIREYSKSISEGISYISEVSKNSESDISSMLIALYSLEEAKDHEGKERAAGAAYLGIIKNNQSALNHALNLIRSDSIEEQFFEILEHEIERGPIELHRLKQPFEDLIYSAESKDFDEAKSQILEHAFAGSTYDVLQPPKISQAKWFELATAWIENLQKFESDLYSIIEKQQLFYLEKSRYDFILFTSIYMFVILITLVSTYFILRSISRNMSRSAHAITDISNENLINSNWLDTNSKSEFGQISRAIINLQDKMKDKKALEAKSLQDMHHQEEKNRERAERQERLNVFIGKNLRNIENLASSIEEMTASIAEIGNQVSKAVCLVEETRFMAEGSSEKVRGLGQLTKEIDSIVDIIRDIAEKTNLLALNATIEAARAGEAGRGFAVVAGEVKVLSSQTTEATGSIDRQVQNIQQESQQVVVSIEQINQSVAGVSEVSNAISAAISQQNIAANEISANAHKIAEFSRRLKDDLEEIAKVG